MRAETDGVPSVVLKAVTFCDGGSIEGSVRTRERCASCGIRI